MEIFSLLTNLSNCTNERLPKDECLLCHLRCLMPCAGCKGDMRTAAEFLKPRTNEKPVVVDISSVFVLWLSCSCAHNAKRALQLSSKTSKEITAGCSSANFPGHESTYGILRKQGGPGAHSRSTSSARDQVLRVVQGSIEPDG